MNKRWLARLSFVLMLAAAAVLIGFAGLRSLALVGIGVLGVITVVFSALRWRRDDTTLVVILQDTILNDMRERTPITQRIAGQYRLRR